MSGTVRHNIALGGVRPTNQDIMWAAQVAGVHDFISTHPDGYNLKLAERGEGLSGGQRQAISIARALVGKPPILIMDEPTSSMDVNAERQLIDRLKGNLASSTLLVITHKATLLDLVDRVIVIDQGKVVADGPKEIVLNPAANQAAAKGAAA
jgi:ATP-binding cassette subfamily C protein LapB